MNIVIGTLQVLLNMVVRLSYSFNPLIWKMYFSYLTIFTYFLNYWLNWLNSYYNSYFYREFLIFSSHVLRTRVHALHHILATEHELEWRCNSEAFSICCDTIWLIYILGRELSVFYMKLDFKMQSNGLISPFHLCLKISNSIANL